MSLYEASVPQLEEDAHQPRQVARGRASPTRRRSRSSPTRSCTRASRPISTRSTARSSRRATAAKFAAARLTGKEAPKHPDTETDDRRAPRAHPDRRRVPRDVHRGRLRRRRGRATSRCRSCEGKWVARRATTCTRWRCRTSTSTSPRRTRSCATTASTSARWTSSARSMEGPLSARAAFTMSAGAGTRAQKREARIGAPNRGRAFRRRYVTCSPSILIINARGAPIRAVFCTVCGAADANRRNRRLSRAIARLASWFWFCTRAVRQRNQ